MFRCSISAASVRAHPEWNSVPYEDVILLCPNMSGSQCDSRQHKLPCKSPVSSIPYLLASRKFTSSASPSNTFIKIQAFRAYRILLSFGNQRFEFLLAFRPKRPARVGHAARYPSYSLSSKCVSG